MTELRVATSEKHNRRVYNVMAHSPPALRVEERLETVGQGRVALPRVTWFEGKASRDRDIGKG